MTLPSRIGLPKAEFNSNRCQLIRSSELALVVVCLIQLAVTGFVRATLVLTFNARLTLRLLAEGFTESFQFVGAKTLSLDSRSGVFEVKPLQKSPQGLDSGPLPSFVPSSPTIQTSFSNITVWKVSH